MRDVTTGMERFIQRAHVHAHVHTNTHVYTSSSHDVSRRSSRQILFRKIGLPLSSTTERQQLCVGRSSRPTNTHVTCVRATARLKNLRGYHPNLRLLQHSISLPFLFYAPDRDTSRIFDVSQPRGMMSPVIRWIRTNHWLQKIRV